MRIAPPIALACLALSAAHTAGASPEFLAQINLVRAQGCAERRGAQPALRTEPRLDRAAQALAAGRSLRRAMADAGYLAVQVASLELTGDEAAVVRAIRRRGCRDLSDPVYREIGTAVLPGVAWIVLAAPLDPPAESDLRSVAARVLKLVNEARARPRRCGRKRHAAAPPLVTSDALQRAALAHAREMAGRDELSHTGQDGSSPPERVARAGYRWRFAGENIAAGQPTPDLVVAGWLDSPGHCGNIMDPDFTEMGVGFAVEPGSAKVIYWALVFAAPIDRVSATAPSASDSVRALMKLPLVSNAVDRIENRSRTVSNTSC